MRVKCIEREKQERTGVTRRQNGMKEIQYEREIDRVRNRMSETKKQEK